MTKDSRQKRDKHALDENGMVLCNPRDQEAAHRAEMEGIATHDTAAVTCPKCISLMHQQHRDRGNSKASLLPDPPERTEGDAANRALGVAVNTPNETSTGARGASAPAAGPFLRMRDVHMMAADLRSGDGVDPREEKRQRLRMSARQKPNLASERLGKQIFDALCLSSLLADLGLEDFTIVNVTPTGRGGHYLVDVRCADPDARFEPRDVERILQEKKGLFRAEVSQSVNRRKAPELHFRVLPAELGL